MLVPTTGSVDVSSSSSAEAPHGGVLLLERAPSPLELHVKDVAGGSQLLGLTYWSHASTPRSRDSWCSAYSVASGLSQRHRDSQQSFRRHESMPKSLEDITQCLSSFGDWKKSIAWEDMKLLNMAARRSRTLIDA